jgi:hypothetical protein
MDNVRALTHRLIGTEVLIVALFGPFFIFPIGPWPWLAGGVLFALWVLRRWQTGRWPLAAGLHLPVLLIIAGALLGTWAAVDRAVAWPRWWSLVYGVFVCSAALHGLRGVRELRWGMVGLAGVTVGVAGLSLVGTDWELVRFIELPWLYERLPTLVRGWPGSGVVTGSDLFNPRWPGILMGMLVPVFIPLIARGQDRPLRLAALLATLAGGFILLLSQSVQGLVACLAGVGLLLVLRWRWMAWGIPAGLLLALVAFFQTGLERVAALTLTLSNPVGTAVVLRMDIWSRAWDMLQAMPYTGIGLNGFQGLQQTIYPGYLLGAEPHAHQLYLQTWLDLGLLGLAGFIWLVVLWFWIMLRESRPGFRWVHQIMQERQALAAGTLAGVVAYLAHGLLDAMMLGSKPSVAFWMLLGLGLASLSQDEQPVAVRESQPRRRISTWLLLFMTSILIVYHLTAPGKLWLNLGSLAGHRCLERLHAGVEISAGCAVRPLDFFERGLMDDPQAVFAYELQGQLLAWQGEEVEAVAALNRRVELDLAGSPGRYDPAGAWLRTIRQEESDEAAELIWIYSHWMNRYPERAEHFVRLALLYEITGARTSAVHTLERAVTVGARPISFPGEVLVLINARP